MSVPTVRPHTVRARELVLAATSPALPMAMAAQMAVLLAFLLVWGGGVPTMTGATVLDQLVVIHGVGLLIVMPWALARAVPLDSQESLGLLALLTGRSTTGIVGARLVAMFLVLVAVALAGLPLLVIGQQMAMAPTGTVAWAMGAGLVLGALVSAVGCLWALSGLDRMRVWLGTSLSVWLAAGIAGRIWPAGATGLLALAAVLVVGWLVLRVRGDASARERHPQHASGSR
ncbi:MAG: hypothetical protein AB7G23_07425 [Vicinamibacterales bacterium]